MPENSIIVEDIAQNIADDNKLPGDTVVCAADEDFSQCDDCIEVVIEGYIDTYHNGLLEMADKHELARRASRRAYMKMRERRNAA